MFYRLTVVVICLVLVLVCNALSDGSITRIFTGKHRRTLRAIAARMKKNNELLSLQLSDINENCLQNVKESLLSRELIQIKFLKAKKKREAKQLGELLAEQTKSELAQVLGHSVLLYLSSDPPAEVSKLMMEEMKRREDLNDT
mmetsp:Transcript_26566/g.44414  ORF Transcript_26566/g.44414 Transcript_26566/m.44414 type:complete len:143 (-) Transcript_26566:3284-3712(-)